LNKSFKIDNNSLFEKTRYNIKFLIVFNKLEGPLEILTIKISVTWAIFVNKFQLILINQSSSYD